MSRLKEPSTWAGVAGLASVARAFVPVQWQWIADMVATAASGAAIKLQERGG